MKPYNNLHLSHELKQQLKLTPEMRLRLDVLQATYLELKDILNKELEENPLIEDVVEVRDDEKEAPAKTDKKEKTEDIEFDKDKARLEEIEGEDYENVFDAEYFKVPSFQQEYNPEFGKIKDQKYNNFSGEEVHDLQADLHKQLNSLHIDDDMYTAIDTLINNLDSNGFLAFELEDIIEKSGMSVDLMQAALEILQSFEPAGVGAYDAQESLLLQLLQKRMKDTLAYQIVDDYFDEISKQQFDKIASSLKVSKANVENAWESIKELSPFPGKNYSTASNEYIRPDIIVHENEDGEYEIELVGDFPEIRINIKYLTEYKKNKETRAFAKKYEERIKTLLSSWGERNKTIEKVVRRILDIQKDYLKDESNGLKPLTLKEIADNIGMHESTVSRIVSRKHIQMPSKVYSLKSFFSSKLSGSGGDVSSDSIKGKIREMIEIENSAKPLTDTAIAKRMDEAGVTIARRTVTKYREQMELLPANLRKK